MDAVVLIIVFVVSAFTCMTAYTLGLIAGQRMSKGQEVKLFEAPLFTSNDKTTTTTEKDDYRVMIDNIDNYDGTPLGQKPLRR